MHKSMIEREKGKNAPLDEFITDTGGKEDKTARKTLGKPGIAVTPQIRKDIESYALDCLGNSETKVHQLAEILRNPGKKNLVTEKVIDRVGEMMYGDNLNIRIMAINAYVKMLEANPDLASKERANKFLGLSIEDNVEIRVTFLRSIRNQVKAFENLDRDTRKRIFMQVTNKDYVVRQEAMVTIEHRFGVPENFWRKPMELEGKKVAGKWLNAPRFNESQMVDLIQGREGRPGMADLSWSVYKLGLESRAAFSHIQKMMDEMEKGNFSDVKFIINLSEKLLGAGGSTEGFNQCLEKSYKLYNAIREKVGEDSKVFAEITHKMFAESIPEAAMKMGYENLSKRLDAVTDEVKRQKPEVFAHSAFYVLENGKLSV